MNATPVEVFGGEGALLVLLAMRFTRPVSGPFTSHDDVREVHCTAAQAHTLPSLPASCYQGHSPMPAAHPSTPPNSRCRLTQTYMSSFSLPLPLLPLHLPLSFILAGLRCAYYQFMPTHTYCIYKLAGHVHCIGWRPLRTAQLCSALLPCQALLHTAYGRSLHVVAPCVWCLQVEIKPEMVGHYLAEFSISYKPVKHGRPGIGATHSSRFIPLK